MFKLFKTNKKQKPRQIGDYPFPKCNMDCYRESRVEAVTNKSKGRMKINRICPIHNEWIRNIIGDEEYNRMKEVGKELDK